MRVLFLAGSVLSVGGMERFNRNLLSALEGCGASLLVVSMNDRQSDGTLPYAFSPCGSRVSPLHKIRFILASVFKGRRFRPKLVVCGHIHFTPLCYLLKAVFGWEYAVITHGFEAWEITRPLIRTSLRQALGIVCVSDYTRKRLLDEVPELEDKTVILPNMVDGDEFYPEEKDKTLLTRYGLSDKRVILSVGRIGRGDRYKGYDRVIEALPRVLQQVPNARYFIVGDGDDREWLTERASKLNLAEHVLFAGKVPQAVLRDYYALCDVFVMPSKKEGFGIVFIEALACGKPVIAGNKDGSVEALLGGEAGLLVDPDDVDEISEAILRVLKGDASDKLLDGGYLRGKILAAYGRDRFNERVGGVLLTFESKLGEKA